MQLLKNGDFTPDTWVRLEADMQVPVSGDVVVEFDDFVERVVKVTHTQHELSTGQWRELQELYEGRSVAGQADFFIDCGRAGGREQAADQPAAGADVLA